MAIAAPLPTDSGAAAPVALWGARLPSSAGLIASADVVLLSDSERARAASFVRERDRAQFVLAWALVRRSLSRCSDIPPAAWDFERSPAGKPSIHRRFGSPLQFSLSHAHGVCLVAITRDRPVGVDIERVDMQAPIESLAHRCMSPAERAALEGLPHRARPGRFFELWTWKEAYAKARGLGLSLPFEQICCSAGLRLGPGIADDARRWSCGAVAAPPGFRAALCVGARP